jgi:hypothetical protein
MLGELHNSDLLDWITTDLGVSFKFGWPYLVIAAGMAMNIVQQIKSQLSLARAD